MLMVDEFEPLVSQYFIPAHPPTPPAPTDSEHKFHETGIGNWLPIGLRFYIPTQSLGITLETFHFPETVFAF